MPGFRLRRERAVKRPDVEAICGLLGWKWKGIGGGESWDLLGALGDGGNNCFVSEED